MRKYLKSNSQIPSLSRVFGLLREQEEDKGEAEEAGDDLFGGGEDEEKKDDEEAGDEGGEDKDEKGDEDKEENKLKISAEDKARLEDSIDDELEGLMVDYETEARKVAAIQSEKMKTESLRKVYRGILYEVAADDIDLKHFAADLARLVKNYDTLMDMESIILNKAYAYIQNNYGEDTVKALKDVLEQEFDIEVERDEIEKDELEVPVAVGASGGSSGGAA